MHIYTLIFWSKEFGLREQAFQESKGLTMCYEN